MMSLYVWIVYVVLVMLCSHGDAWSRSRQQAPLSTTTATGYCNNNRPLQSRCSKLHMSSTAKSDMFQRRSLPSHPVISQAIADLKDVFAEIDLHTMSTVDLILRLYQAEQVDSLAFHGVNGYGYGDVGREKFDRIVAKLLGAEKALVRLQFFSGTHAIATALFACLRPQDEILCISGKPYDTLEEVIGLRENVQCGNTKGSLKDWQIGYQEIDLLFQHPHNGRFVDKTDPDLAYTQARFDLSRIAQILDSNGKVKLLHIQRSCGYQWRPSIRIEEIKRLVDFIEKEYKSKGREIVIFCDNCYGELVETHEPTHVGVDLIAGSLIKNLGGTLAPCGGYIAGRSDLVSQAEVHLSAPGVEGGATFNQYQHLFQGLFMAPSIVGESLKGAHLLSYLMETQFGFACNPPAKQPRTDIIQAVRLENRQRLISFCESVQKKSPVGAYIRPVPGMTPGYGTEVIFADGTFIEGSTLELSADGPLRPPFVAYSQGCTHWTHWALVLEEVLKSKAFTTASDFSRSE